jgi:hypothetical protein
MGNIAISSGDIGIVNLDYEKDLSKYQINKCIYNFHGEKSMFNMKKHTKSAQVPYEKYHRKNTLGPQADDTDPIHEKKLPHRDGFEQTITEDQMDDRKESQAQIVQKKLDSVTSKYVTHRNNADLVVPPISAVVEMLRQERLSEREESKKPHWSQTFNEKKQQGALPKWSKNAPQHDKVVLNNDPRRFPKDEIQPLVGSITTADVHHIANSIKEGKSREYDNAVGAILRSAHEEGRELTSIERKTVVNLKIARTNYLLPK